MADSTKNCDMVWFGVGFWHVIDGERFIVEIEEIEEKISKEEKKCLL